MTAEDRLRAIAMIAAMKREESLTGVRGQRLPFTSANYESILMIAVAPEQIFQDGTLERLPGDFPSNEELFTLVVDDIKRLFAPDHWPWWLKSGTTV